ncbi:hypothetical protein WK25_15270 [Burkholderia latens]|nr:hypothetical protein WK25_15270 [Burkholderia latens]
MSIAPKIVGVLEIKIRPWDTYTVKYESKKIFYLGMIFAYGANLKHPFCTIDVCPQFLFASYVLLLLAD